ncbi:MAG: hypothetical protein SFW07_04680 [Gammaproteobacteria bacterium]|nr:hypothetical protein [Gammaproteobacteria bacterium]
MSTEPNLFNIPHVFMRIMEYLPKKDQKAVALTDKKHSRMAYAFNFWYYDAHRREANIPAQLVAMSDQNRKALSKDRDPQFAKKMAELLSSVPKDIQTQVTRFCTPLVLDFLSNVESDVTTSNGRRTLRSIKAGHVGENLFRALSSFREKVLPLIKKEIEKYEDMVKPDEDIVALTAAHQDGTLVAFIQENRDRIFDAYKYELDEKGVDTANLADVSDETLMQYSVSLMENYEAPKRDANQESEYQRLKAFELRLGERSESQENKENQVQLQQQPEPLSLSPPLSPH